MQSTELKFSKFLNEDQVFSIFTKNYSQSFILWAEFQRVWYYRGITAFNDIDKFFIVLYFLKKTFKSYSEHFINKTFDEFYSQESIEIEKFNIVDLARDLNFSKETVRRKLIELEKSNILNKDKKKIKLNIKNNHSKAEEEVKGFAKLMALFTKILAHKKLIERSFSENEIENLIKNNFTRFLLPFLEFQIKYSLRVRSVFKDTETWFIWGILVYNQTLNYLKNNKKNGSDMNLNQFTKIIPHETPGLNAMSISELSGIPRPTVLRKINLLIKEKAVHKSKTSLYTLTENLLKKYEPLRSANNKDLCSLITKLLNLII